MLRYAITDVGRQHGTAQERRNALVQQVRGWCSEGVDFVQLREKTLAAGELLSLAEALLAEAEHTNGHTRLLINARADIAAASRAHGVHLTAAPGELTPAQVRSVFEAAGQAAPVISISCHSPADAERARAAGADLVLFGPVFEKVVGGTQTAPGSGLALLRKAVHVAESTPVLALGGVTLENAPACLEAGAAGIAGIRLFAPRGSYRNTTK